MTKKTNVILIIIIALVVTALTFTFPPISQDPAYHNFADKRGWLGIPNFGDVMSNLPFLFFGFMGLGAANLARPGMFTMTGERIPWKVFFLGTFLVGFGSGYYHWEPNNHTLVWDRLPMTIAFMSFFSVVVMERLNEKSGLVLLPILLIAGAASVFYWDHTELLGNGDLRPYALVQFLPMLLIPLMFWYTATPTIQHLTSETECSFSIPGLQPAKGLHPTIPSVYLRWEIVSPLTS